MIYVESPSHEMSMESGLEPSVVDYPLLNYSKKAVNRAGVALAADMPWDPARQEEFAQIFRIAHDWRVSHTFPMRRLRAELSHRVRKAGAVGVTAARLKRMKSIRKKLAREPGNLVQIQDIGGCRAILNTMDEVNAVLSLLRDGSMRHGARLDRSYLDQPKRGGYRSHHLVFDFAGRDEAEAAHNGRRIEVQVRTHLQHAWATAVEAIGLIRGEDLKAGEGNADWLRFFELISSEYARAEGTALVCPRATQREAIDEIVDLNKRLGAVGTLENIRQAFRFTESTSTNARYFLIEYDNDKHVVNVVGYSAPKTGAEQYYKRESPREAMNTVLVEVDKIEDLRSAYPNYYLDVRLFASNVERIIGGKKLHLIGDGTAPDQEPVVKRRYDLDWHFNRRG